MRSNKPIAEPFQECVCEEILPSIRKTGEYKFEEYKKMLEQTEIENKKLTETNKNLSSKINNEYIVKNRLHFDRYETNRSQKPIPIAPFPPKAKKNVLLLPSKPCNICNIIKPLEEFNNANSHRDGKENCCIICRRERQAEILEEQLEKYENITESKCNICNEEKKLEEFFKDKCSPNGIMRRCKKCHSEKQKQISEKPKMILTEKNVKNAKILNQ